MTCCTIDHYMPTKHLIGVAGVLEPHLVAFLSSILSLAQLRQTDFSFQFKGFLDVYARHVSWLEFCRHWSYSACSYNTHIISLSYSVLPSQPL